ncbi:hypothetical protein BT96DRAFT_988603 [Gymnopus androsaceus JB14]|uniref:hAT-like transposase RNase-H fold domain-containing protein n=1 Tax=Gymnopus androsaceus JB14 TaxID=1447944 RepID=A0A6A4I5Y7_9AGAR|nr:hypothetical protein BT96DRAFT_988603 [Gymnopus androsaceus JB14]
MSIRYARCFAHVVNLACKAMLAELEILGNGIIGWLRSLMKMVISSFFTSDHFHELGTTHLLTDQDWALLEEVKVALQVPHLFQQCLSAEKIPALCDPIPAFEAMFRKWAALCLTHPSIRTAVSAGMDKLEDYMDVIWDIPAYMLAMAVNPMMKLEFYQCFCPEEYVSAKDYFVKKYTNDVDLDDGANVEEEETLMLWAN